MISRSLSKQDEGGVKGTFEFPTWVTDECARARAHTHVRKDSLILEDRVMKSVLNILKFSGPVGRFLDVWKTGSYTNLELRNN